MEKKPSWQPLTCVYSSSSDICHPVDIVSSICRSLQDPLTVHFKTFPSLALSSPCCCSATLTFYVFFFFSLPLPWRLFSLAPLGSAEGRAAQASSPLGVGELNLSSCSVLFLSSWLNLKKRLHPLPFMPRRDWWALQVPVQLSPWKRRQCKRGGGRGY